MKNQRLRVARLKLDLRGKGPRVALQSKSPRGTYFTVAGSVGGSGVKVGDLVASALNEYMTEQEELPF